VCALSNERDSVRIERTESLVLGDLICPLVWTNRLLVSLDKAHTNDLVLRVSH